MKEENSALALLFCNQAGFVWVSLNLDRYHFIIYCYKDTRLVRRDDIFYSINTYIWKELTVSTLSSNFKERYSQFLYSIRNAVKGDFVFVLFYYIMFDDWLWDCFGVVALLRILEQ